ncbi:MAG: response regulator [Bdellovibrionales bacterium]|nr:response regulator [Bdellovibrionales bacterium]
MSLDKISKAQEEALRSYLSTKKILMADTSPSSKASLHQALTELGAKATNIKIASSFRDAELLIGEFKPEVVICDYDLGKRCGLDLLQKQRAEQPDSKKSIFVMVTGNTSQSAVARAAEEDVDAYVIKPFTTFTLRQALMKTAMLKMSPPEYLVEIEAGREAIKDGKLDDAIKHFEKAKTLDPQPALACAYIGQVNYMKSQIAPAEGSYQEGLGHNKIHYKCLVGLYEALMGQKRYREAYDVVKKISNYFPANPQRLTMVLRLAIMTQSYDDVEKYYQMFTKIDERSPDVVRYISAALVVCGKYYLQTNVPSRALELYKKAATAAYGNPKVLAEIVQGLCDFGQAKEAEGFLKRYPPELQKTAPFKALEVLILDRMTENASLVLDKSRSLIQEGLEDPLLYQVAIRRAALAKQNDIRDDLFYRATKKYADQTERFNAAKDGKTVTGAVDAAATPKGKG